MSFLILKLLFSIYGTAESHSTSVNMGRNTKRVKDFINDIPDKKLSAFITSFGTLYSDDEFRLDMQGVSDKGRCAISLAAQHYSPQR